MTIQEIIALGNMGYTKEDIAALSGESQPVVQQAQPVVQQAQPVVQQAQPVQQQPDFLEALKLLGQMQQNIQTPSINAAQPTQTQPAQPVQTTQPAQPTQTVQQAQPTISLTADDLVKLTQGIAVKTAAGSVETPRSANDIILGMLDAYESTTKED